VLAYIKYKGHKLIILERVRDWEKWKKTTFKAWLFIVFDESGGNKGC
jgi:hypothetical protein